MYQEIMGAHIRSRGPHQEVQGAHIRSWGSISGYGNPYQDIKGACNRSMVPHQVKWATLGQGGPYQEVKGAHIRRSWDPVLGQGAHIKRSRGLHLELKGNSPAPPWSQSDTVKRWFSRFNMLAFHTTILLLSKILNLPCHCITNINIETHENE